MRILFFLVLHSGFLQFVWTTNRLRSFRPVPRLMWDETLDCCKKTGESLITLYDDDDAEFVSNYLKAGDKGNPNMWLGLHKSRTSVTTWSDGTVPTMPEFKTPPEVSGGEQKCGAAENGAWQAYTCSDKRSFICQKGKTYVMMEEQKDWCGALQYCRRHFTDLAIITNNQEAEDVKQKSRDNSLWIGLLHDEWEWVDRSCSTHRNQRNFTDHKCSSIRREDGDTMNGFDCTFNAIGLCSRGSVRIKVITELELSWEEALDYCEENHSRLLWIEDEEDQKAVEQWLNYTYHYHAASDPGPLWISTRQSSVFGFWIWSDRIVRWDNWEGGKQPELGSTSQCGVINKNFTWSHEDCSTALHFICEEDILFLNE